MRRVELPQLGPRHPHHGGLWIWDSETPPFDTTDTLLGRSLRHGFHSRLWYKLIAEGGGVISPHLWRPLEGPLRGSLRISLWQALRRSLR